MSKKLDQILVVDVEATCWQGKPPPGQENEIIEIGICVLDVVSGKPLEKDSILVKPERSRVSEFCTKLTTLTQEQVDQGISFVEACSMLQDKYLSARRVWASYGDYDRNQFQKQCTSRFLRYPFGPRHINIKTLFAISQALPHEVGMAQGLDLLNLPLEGTHHRGGDDAWNIARIFSTLLLQLRTRP
ncbi:MULTISPECIES: 3'-5' exonuclease [unclassified Moorena]|uniref:3'-5' exonuclease n=1 Tax=unclassified Moorena TaxID=2683338 RepID=UPI0013C092DE|nr:MULTISPECIES: 3'-5' exonuclease [unclassified Moorena]NEQ16696.1 exonuclease domain-containing protein [Moorena sp. SIO3E2]NES45735.1 exonuclease domain-containing protein [Moorena sp. SIO2C4]NES85519.1 exonuclease domain-containing protein [Moorena sp. SIO2B7]NET67945.1 exonuclease domain-containing protein [Moorena sp. SIO1G6]